MKIRLLTFLACCLGFALSGCATHSTLVIARCPKPLPTTARKIAIMPSPQPRPEDVSLKKCLTTELEQTGLQIVPQTEADFMLSCAIEEDWQSYHRPTTPYMQSTTGPIRVPPGSMLYEGSRWSGEAPATPTYTEEHVGMQGIRIRVYQSQGLRAGRFDMAWEGYIEAGKQLDEEREPLLLKTLLRYFGHSYSGKVKLAE